MVATIAVITEEQLVLEGVRWKRKGEVNDSPWLGRWEWVRRALPRGAGADGRNRCGPENHCCPSLSRKSLSSHWDPNSLRKDLSI